MRYFYRLLLSFLLILSIGVYLETELNQGLDEDSEVPAHNLMVEATCRETASQSFLFTPKLRRGLNYHPLMTVLCVLNVNRFLEKIADRPEHDDIYLRFCV